MKEFEVTMTGNGKTFRVRQGESILAAALRQGVMLPYSCKNGTCGSCKGLLKSGEVHYPFHPPLALEREDFAEGYALLCQAEPVEDLVLQVREIEAVRDIQIRMLPARVVEKTLLTEDVVRLRLRLPASQRLQFLAGQYVDMLLAGGKRRAFSIASCPSLENEIELHIRHVEGGDFTGHVFTELQERDILRFEGPLGNFFVRNDPPDRPMIMMGGGTGFAPLKSMIENLLDHDDRREIHLYWGARSGRRSVSRRAAAELGPGTRTHPLSQGDVRSRRLFTRAGFPRPGARGGHRRPPRPGGIRRIHERTAGHDRNGQEGLLPNMACRTTGCFTIRLNLAWTCRCGSWPSRTRPAAHCRLGDCSFTCSPGSGMGSLPWLRRSALRKQVIDGSSSPLRSSNWPRVS